MYDCRTGKRLYEYLIKGTDGLNKAHGQSQTMQSERRIEMLKSEYCIQLSHEDQAHAVLLVYLHKTMVPKATHTTSTQFHRRRPLRPPFRLVESDGVGVTSSILPIFMPERANARNAD